MHLPNREMVTIGAYSFQLLSNHAAEPIQVLAGLALHGAVRGADGIGLSDGVIALPHSRVALSAPW